MSNHSEEEVSQIVAQSLQQVLSGKSSVESVLTRYPDLVDVLSSELDTAIYLVRVSPQFGPSPGYVKKSKARLMERIEQEAAYEQAAYRRLQARAAAQPRDTQPRTPASQSWLWRFVAIAAVFLFLFMGFTGTVYAARDAVLGDSLYGVKRWTEDAAYLITMDTQQQARLRLAFSSRRLDEAEKLIARGQTALVAQVMADYEVEVGQAIAALAKFKQNHGETEELAEYFHNELEHQAGRLNHMAENAPASSAVLIKAMKTSKRGVDQADAMNSGRPNAGPRPTEEDPSVDKQPTRQDGGQGQPAGGQQRTGQPGNGQGTDKGKGSDREGGATQEVKPTKEPGSTGPQRTPEPGGGGPRRTPEPDGGKDSSGKPKSITNGPSTGASTSASTALTPTIALATNAISTDTSAPNVEPTLTPGSGRNNGGGTGGGNGNGNNSGGQDSGNPNDKGKPSKP